MLKQADSVGSASPDPAVDAAAAESIPAPSISNKPPPGQTGPRGMQSRQTYSRVNTGTPQTPEAGASAQKNMAPGGLDFLPKLSEARMNTTPRPTIQDMVKAAMAGAISRVDITNEAIHQYGGEVKTASAEYEGQSLPTDLINKLADALGYVADQIEKGAAIEFSGGSTAGVGAGEGPGHLHVMQAEVISSKNPSQPGQTGGRDQAGAPMESGATKTAPTNAMGTNESMRHPEQPADPMNGKTAGALAAANLDRLSKVGSVQKTSSATQYVRNVFAQVVKQAEDAMNPAQISAGKEPGPAASGTASGEAVPTQPADVNAQTRLIESNMAAINYTKREAKRDPHEDARRVFNSPVMKDPVLDQVWANSGKAGVKTSSRNDVVKIAAARALLSKLSASVKQSAPQFMLHAIYRGDVAEAKKGRKALIAQGAKDYDIKSHDEYIKAHSGVKQANSTESRKLKTSNMGTAGTPPPPPARQSTISGPAFTQPSV